MDETALNQALASMQLGQSVLVAQLNQGIKLIKAQALEIEELKKQLAKKESAVDQATRQVGIPPIGKVESPVYPEATP